MIILRQLQHILLPLFLLCGLLSGCAAVWRSPEPNWLAVCTDPDSARIYVNGTYKGLTPVSLPLPVEDNYLMEIHKQGYKTLYDTITTTVGTKWLLSDIVSSLAFFAVPIAVDAISGRWYIIKDEDRSRSFCLVPGKSAELPVPISLPTDSSTSRFALSVGIGVVLPAYQVPTFPQSYELGLSYAPTPSMQVLATMEFNGIGITYRNRNEQRSPSVADAAVQLFSGMVGLRGHLFDTGIYAIGGVGALRAVIPEFPASTPGLQPFVTFGIGYVLPGDTFFLEFRPALVLTELYLSSAQLNKPTLHYTSLRAGFMLQF